jgi:hypothetical protein
MIGIDNINQNNTGLNSFSVSVHQDHPEPKEKSSGSAQNKGDNPYSMNKTKSVYHDRWLALDWLYTV